MGGGASTNTAVQSSSISPVFFSNGMVMCGCRLQSDEDLSISFLDYVKSGVWLDRLARFAPKAAALFSDSERFLEGSTEDLLARYSLDKERVQLLMNLPSSGKHRFASRTASSISMDLVSDSIACSCFREEELCSLMLRVVYPMYLDSSSYRRFVRFGNHPIMHQRDDDSSIASSMPDPNLMQTAASKHAVDILYSCATHFEGEHLLSIIRGDWVQKGATAIKEHALSICVVHATASDNPLVYANDAFCAQFEYSAEEVKDLSLTALCGPTTEQAQYETLLSAFKSNVHTKTWVTLCTKHMRAVLDLVAVETVGPYAVMVHFPVVPGKSDWGPLKVKHAAFRFI
jgi:PAS domain-containing protein